MKIDDAIGQRFGSLVALSRVEAGRDIRNKTIFKVECRCDCGTIKVFELRALKKTNTVSCGCHKGAKIAAFNRKHGLKSTKAPSALYLVWRGIKTRCYNPKAKAFKTYGAKGIALAPQWLDDPEAFVRWCLTNGWKPGLTIERKGNDGDYEPDNIEFITKSENSRRKEAHYRFVRGGNHVIGFLSLP